MIEEKNFKTYLSISPQKFGIYLFDIKNFYYLYKQEVKIENNFTSSDLKTLSKFLDDNVFKIEKLLGQFLKNICLIIKTSEITEIKIGIKKKNYQEIINKNFLDTLLVDAKDLFKESYHNQQITHMIVDRYLVDGVSHTSFNNDFRGNDFCVELQFNFISSNFVLEINKILEKYQIKIIKYLDNEYMTRYFKDHDFELCEMAYKIENGCNDNEVRLIPKNTKKKGFFEKFFQLFS